MDNHLKAKLALRVLYNEALRCSLLTEEFLKEQRDIIEAALSKLYEEEK